MKYPIIIALFSLGLLLVSSSAWARDTVAGHKKPAVCLESNIRCILKKVGGTTYWCLKSNIQRNLDSRRSSSPIRRTLRSNLGNCAKLIPMGDYKTE